MKRITGRNLNQKWGVGAKHALYREDGKWYMPLKRFPGALFDATGYVVFETSEQYENCRYLRIGVRVNVPSGIASIPGYVKEPMRAGSPIHSAVETSKRRRPVMSNWQVRALRWGGLLLAVVFAVALILVYFVVDTVEGETPSSAPEIIYWVLLIIGGVAAVAGFRKKNLVP